MIIFGKFVSGISMPNVFPAVNSVFKPKRVYRIIIEHGLGCILQLRLDYDFVAEMIN